VSCGQCEESLHEIVSAETRMFVNNEERRKTEERKRAMVVGIK